MVQWLADPRIQAQRTTNTNTNSNSTTRDSSSSLPHKRLPRRGYSLTEVQGDFLSDFLSATYISSASTGNNSYTTNSTPPPSSPSSSPSPSPSPSSSPCITTTTTHIPTEATIPENAILGTPSPNTPHIRPHPSATTTTTTTTSHKKRPPPRSYSATDKEPEDDAASRHPPRNRNHHHRNYVGSRSRGGPSCFLDLPPEMHYTVFDLLDPIDAACLALVHPALYAIHRRHAGTNAPVALSSRYHGPNDLEWAWHANAAAPSSTTTTTTTTVTTKNNIINNINNNTKNLDTLRVKGQVYCRKCGISRCELHRHLKSWMGDAYEYCAIKERFAAPAPLGAKPYCFMSSPKDRRRCGRHGGGIVTP